MAHNTTISKHSYIGANSVIAGGCIIGECVTVGLGAIIRAQTKIFNNTTIGMGVTIHHDILSQENIVFNQLEKNGY